MFLERRRICQNINTDLLDKSKYSEVLGTGVEGGESAAALYQELQGHQQRKRVSREFGKIFRDTPFLIEKIGEQYFIDKVQGRVQDIFKKRLYEVTFHPSHIEALASHFVKMTIVKNHLTQCYKKYNDGDGSDAEKLEIFQKKMDNQWHTLADTAVKEYEKILTSKYNLTPYTDQGLATSANGSFEGVELSSIFSQLKKRFTEKETVGCFALGISSVAKNRVKMGEYAEEQSGEIEKMINTAMDKNPSVLDERNESILNAKNDLINGKTEFFYQWIDFDGAKRPTGIMFSAYKETLFDDLEKYKEHVDDWPNIEKISNEFNRNDGHLYAISKFLEHNPEYAQDSVYSALLTKYKKQRKEIIKKLIEEKEIVKKKRENEDVPDGKEHLFVSDRVRFGLRLDPKYIEVLHHLYFEVKKDPKCKMGISQGDRVRQLKLDKPDLYEKYEELRHITGQIFDIQHMDRDAVVQIMMAQAECAEDYIVVQNFLKDFGVQWRDTHNNEQLVLDEEDRDVVEEKEIEKTTKNISVCALFEGESVTEPDKVLTVLQTLWKEWKGTEGIGFFEDKVSEIFFAGSDLSKGMSQPAARLQVECAAIAIEKFNILYGTDIRVKLGSGEAFFRQLGYLDNNAYESFIRGKILHPEKFCINNNGDIDNEQLKKAYELQGVLKEKFGPNWRERLIKSPKGLFEILEGNPLINSITLQSRGREKVWQMAPSQFLRLTDTLKEIKSGEEGNDYIRDTFRKDTRKKLSDKGLLLAIESCGFQEIQDEINISEEEIDRLNVKNTLRQKIRERKVKRDSILDDAFAEADLNPTDEYVIFACEAKKIYQGLIGDEEKDIMKPLGAGGLAAHIEMFASNFTMATRDRSTARPKNGDDTLIDGIVALASAGIDSRCIAANTNSNIIFPLGLVGFGKGIQAVKNSCEDDSAKYKEFLRNDIRIVDAMTLIQDYKDIAPIMFSIMDDVGSGDLANILREEWEAIGAVYNDMKDVLEEELWTQKVPENEKLLKEYITEKEHHGYTKVSRNKRNIKDKKYCTEDFLGMMDQEANDADSIQTVSLVGENGAEKLMTPLYRSLFSNPLDSESFSTKNQKAKAGQLFHLGKEVVESVGLYLREGKKVNDILEDMMVEIFNGLDSSQSNFVSLADIGEELEQGKKFKLFDIKIETISDVQKAMREIGNDILQNYSLDAVYNIQGQTRGKVKRAITRFEKFSSPISEKRKKFWGQVIYSSSVMRQEQG